MEKPNDRKTEIGKYLADGKRKTIEIDSMYMYVTYVCYVDLLTDNMLNKKEKKVFLLIIYFKISHSIFQMLIFKQILN